MGSSADTRSRYCHFSPGRLGHRDCTHRNVRASRQLRHRHGCDFLGADRSLSHPAAASRSLIRSSSHRLSRSWAPLDNATLHCRNVARGDHHVYARSTAFVHRLGHRPCRTTRILFLARKESGGHGSMNVPARTKRSLYMEWAKTHSHAKYNLATSGLMGVAHEEFPFRLDELEITAPGNYGYQPLQVRLALHTGAPEECIVAAAGTSMANHLAMAAVLEPGDEVLLEQPAYGPLLDVASYLGARVKRLPRRFESRFSISLEELQRAITASTRLVVLTNLHNPSGALLSAEMVGAIGKLAIRSKARVLIDEVYLEMLFGKPAPFSFPIGNSIASAKENPFIVTSSLTKVYGLSGLRCGWILAAPALARRMWLLNDLYAATGALPAERLSVVALDHLEKFRDRARTLLAANRALLDSFLDSRRDIECFRPPAGTVVFPRLPHGRDPEAFFRLLREKFETTVVPGSFFEMPRHFRINIGGDTPTLRAGLERLSAALDALTKR